MKIKARSIAACVASLIILALASIDATLFAQTPTKSLKDQLVGHWQLVSVSVNNTTPYGANPQGSMFFDAGGHYSVIVVTAGKARNVSYFGIAKKLRDPAWALSLLIGQLAVAFFLLRFIQEFNGHAHLRMLRQIQRLRRLQDAVFERRGLTFR